MSKTKFTKGPWHVSDDMGDPVYVTTEKEKICSINYKEPYDKTDANAALIAAAPEMYWMLEKCRTALRECGMTCLSEDVFLLLKKARGEK